MRVNFVCFGVFRIDEESGIARDILCSSSTICPVYYLGLRKRASLTPSTFSDFQTKKKTCKKTTKDNLALCIPESNPPPLSLGVD